MTNENTSLEPKKEISILKQGLDLKSLKNDNFKSVIEKVENQAVLDNVFDDIQAQIQDIKGWNENERHIVADLVVELWKHDRKHDHMHRDDNTYKKLLYKILGGEDFSDEAMNKAKAELDTMQQFSDDIKDILLGFIRDNPKIQTDIGSYNLHNMIERLRVKYLKLSSTYDEIVQELQKVKDIKSLKKAFDTISDILDKKLAELSKEYSKQKTEYQKKVAALEENFKIIDKIAERELINKKETSESVDCFDKKRIALQYIDEMERTVKTLRLPFGEGFVLSGIKQARQRINDAQGPEVMQIIKEELQRAGNLCSKYSSMVGNLKDVINRAQAEIFGKAPDTKEQQSFISWRTLLETNNTSTESFDAYMTNPIFEQAYNDAFDIMYKVNMTPTNSSITFRGENISINQGHIDKFKNLIESQLGGGEDIDGKTITLSYVGSDSKGAESHYPQGMRLVKVSNSSNGSSGEATIVSFGDDDRLARDLTKGLQQNLDKQSSVWQTIDIKAFFTPVPGDKEFVEKSSKNIISDSDKDPTWGSYAEYKGGLVLDAHGGSRAFDALFQSGRKDHLIQYFRVQDNLRNFLDHKSVKEDNIKKTGGDKYIMSLMQVLESDDAILKQYLEFVKDNGNTNSSYLGKEFSTKQIVVGKLFDIVSKKDPHSYSEMIKDVTELKVSLEAQANSSENAPKTLEQKIASVVGILFQHPIGKMLLQFLDSIFKGKGGLLAKFGKIPGFSDAVEKEFKKQYGLDQEQTQVIEDITGYDKDPIFLEDDIKNLSSNRVEYDKKFNDLAKKIDFSKENGLFDTFYTNNVGGNEVLRTHKDGDRDVPVLDPNILYSYWKSNQTSLEGKIPFDTVFSVATTKVISIKSDADQEKLKALLNNIATDKKTIDAIRNADFAIKTGGKGWMGRDVGVGINTELGYVKAMAAYLMGGSKGDGKLHYLYSENDLFLSEPNLDLAKNSSDSQQQG